MKMKQVYISYNGCCCVPGPVNKLAICGSRKNLTNCVTDHTKGLVWFLFNLYIIRVWTSCKRNSVVCENLKNEFSFKILAIFYETQPIVRWPLQARPSGPGHHAKTLSLMLGPVCPAGPEEPGGAFFPLPYFSRFWPISTWKGMGNGTYYAPQIFRPSAASVPRIRGSIKMPQTFHANLSFLRTPHFWCQL